MVLGDDVAFCVRKMISFLRSIQLFILANWRTGREGTGKPGQRLPGAYDGQTQYLKPVPEPELLETKDYKVHMKDRLST